MVERVEADPSAAGRDCARIPATMHVARNDACTTVRVDW